LESWAWVLVGLLIFGACIVFVLSVPLEIRLELDTTAERRMKTRVYWLFGLMQRDLSETGRKPGKKERTKKKRKGPGILTIWEILSTRGLFAAIKKLVKRIFRRLHIIEFKLKMRIGFDDPADGGLVFATIGAVRPFMPQRERFEFFIQPELSDKSFVEGNGRCTLHVHPVALIPPILMFIFSIPVLKAGRTLWKSRKRSRQPENIEAKRMSRKRSGGHLKDEPPD